MFGLDRIEQRPNIETFKKGVHRFKRPFVTAVRTTTAAALAVSLSFGQDLTQYHPTSAETIKAGQTFIVPPIPARYDIATATSSPEIMADEGEQIVQIEYTPGYGQESFPWAVEDPKIEGLEATGLNPGGVYDKYDTLDIWLNGSNSKAAQRQMYTRDFLAGVYAADVARGGASWTGDCRGAVSASYFSPIIEGDITITVAGKGSVTFTEKERKLLATKRYSGLALDPDYRDLSDYNTFAEMSIRVKNGEPVVANFSPSPAPEEWWGLVTDMDDATGIVTMTIFTTWSQTDEQITMQIPYSSLSAIALLHLDRAEPGFEGNRELFNEDVIGLATGTHQLVGQ